MRIGVAAELASPAELVATVRALREAGVSELDAFAPFDVPELADAMRARRSRIPLIAAGAGFVGGAGAYAYQYWMWVIDYPLSIGGHAHHTPLAFIPIAFEMAILFAAIATFVSALVLGGLPRLYHPVFDLPGFESATRDGFWVAVGEGDIDKAEGLLSGARRVVKP